MIPWGEYIDSAYEWVCKRREHHSPNSDIWHVRHHWSDIKPYLLKELQAQIYQYKPVRYYQIDDKLLGVWHSLDAIVLKMIAIWLDERLHPVLSDRVYHIRGSRDHPRGVQAGLTDIKHVLTDYKYAFRTDVKSYYATIDHEILLERVRRYIDHPYLLHLIRGYMRYTIYDDGIYRTNECGLSLGCPLSPLLAALYLIDMDQALERQDVYYIRYMDDWLVMARTRHKLRKAIRTSHQMLRLHRQTHRPEKTMIGKITKGFDFLGVYFSSSFADDNIEEEAEQNRDKTKRYRCYTRVSLRSWTTHFRRICQLYEQGASIRRIDHYRQRWIRYKASITEQNIDLLGGITLTIPMYPRRL